MKPILIVILILIAFVMIYLGVKADLLPPMLTGGGFLIIAALFAVGLKR